MSQSPPPPLTFPQQSEINNSPLYSTIRTKIVNNQFHSLAGKKQDSSDWSEKNKQMNLRYLSAIENVAD